MNIGKLRNKIELQSYMSAANAIGEKTKTWTAYATVWAWIRPMSGREVMNAQQTVGEITHKVTIRYNSTVAVKSRIKYYDNVKEAYRYFDINFVGDRDEKNEFIELLCKEKV